MKRAFELLLVMLLALSLSGCTGAPGSSDVSTESTPTTEPTYVTQPTRTPNAAGVVNIVNWSLTDGQNNFLCVIDYFYTDTEYDYYFPYPYAVSVQYADGSEKAVEDALLDGDVTITDLESFGIGFGKEERKVSFRIEPNEAADYPELFYSDDEYDYYFSKQIGDHVYVLYHGLPGELLKDALIRGFITIEEFVNHDSFLDDAIPYYRVPKEAG